MAAHNVTPPPAKLAIALHPVPLAGSDNAKATGDSAFHKENPLPAAHVAMGHLQLLSGEVSTVLLQCSTSPDGRDKCRAFSLVELSIVLVILGLLTGGILAGQSLIRAAELRAVTTEYNRYVSAVNTFKDKYFAIPGDMNNATQFWGRLNTNADCLSNSGLSVASTPGTCDGDGDGAMDLASATSQSGEIFQFWRQLALAGLIEGSYTGTAGTGGAQDSILGTNVPKSRMSNAGWFTMTGGIGLSVSVGGSTVNYAGDYGNILGFGGKLINSFYASNALKPEEAWNIDTKIDDGKPGTGKLIVRENGSFNNPALSTQCTTSTTNSDYTGNYNLTNSSVICALYFLKAL